MTYAEAMLEAHPQKPSVDREALVACIEACFACAQACTACADACLSEGDVAMMVDCIRLDLACADVCATTGKVLSRAFDHELVRPLLDACAAACRSCAAECERHEHEHCTTCAQACRRCEEACVALLDALG